MIENSNNTMYLLANSKKTNTLWCMFGSIFVIGLTSVYLYIDKNLNWPIGVLIAVDIILVVAFSLLVYFLSRNKYIVFKESGFEVIKRDKKTLYSYKDFDGTNVTRNYYNGIYMGTDRAIKVINPLGKKDEIACPGIGKDAFSEIVALINKHKFYEIYGEKNADDYYEHSRNFAIPRDEIIKSHNIRTTTYVSLISSGTIALSIIWIWAGKEDVNSDMASIKVLTSVFSILTLIIGGYFVFKCVRNNKRVKLIPERINISNEAIVIDGKSIAPSMIANISMVPGNYQILERDMLLLLKDGTKYQYGFGSGKGNTKLTYVDYPQLYAAIQSWCLVKGISFLAILG
ncbi:MAG: hypothetical protein MJ093_07630 [Saccharofermentans sp.]|nr:hypothetical protein [Saccharofermentans sp.]